MASKVVRLSFAQVLTFSASSTWMERRIREQILQVHSDVVERLHLRIPATVFDNLVLVLYRFDHCAMKHDWLCQVTWGTLELLQHTQNIRIYMKL
ncbi:hypothetical protein Ahy_B05g078124 isoform A [Arachis hypogaea]|uniref:Uncharacterized protein n=1 Tax=Arachis hypogaea TaxID=3818 RepID=A0A444Z6D7_ARAHY|nr:hypothetical protein Ahy_B05g078124 isoform A [Arachis hypogaea]